MALAKWNEAYACVIKCRKKTQQRGKCTARPWDAKSGEAAAKEEGDATLTTVRRGRGELLVCVSLFKVNRKSMLLYSSWSARAWHSSRRRRRVEHDKNVYVNCEKQFLCPGNGTGTGSGRAEQVGGDRRLCVKWCKICPILDEGGLGRRQSRAGECGAESFDDLFARSML